MASKAVAFASFWAFLPGAGFAAGGTVEAPVNAAAGPRAQPTAMLQFPQAPEPMGGELKLFLGTEVGQKLAAIDPFYGELKTMLAFAPAKALASLGPLAASGSSLRAGLKDAAQAPGGLDGLSKEKSAQLIERFLAAHVQATRKVDDAVEKDVMRFHKETSVEAWLALKEQLEVLAPYSEYAWGQYKRVERVATELKELRAILLAKHLETATGDLAAAASAGEAGLGGIERQPTWSKTVAPAVVSAVFEDDAIKQAEVAELYDAASGGAQKAARWYQEAARPRPWGFNETKDFGQAQYKMGRRYEKGLGVPQDLVKAHAYYALAASADKYFYGNNSYYANAARGGILELTASMDREELAKALTGVPIDHRTELLPDESPSRLGSTFHNIAWSFRGHRDYKLGVFMSAMIAAMGALLAIAIALSPGQNPAGAWTAIQLIAAVFGGMSLFFGGLAYLVHRLRTAETRKLIREAIARKTA